MVFSPSLLPEIFFFFFLLRAAASGPAMAAQQKTYIVHLDPTKISVDIKSIIDSLTPSSSTSTDPPAELLYIYTSALSGFAAKLSLPQLASLRQLDGFLAGNPDELLTLHTSHSPEFLGLTPGRGLWSSANLAADVIIGIIDTGVWPEHPSFDDAGFSPVPARWKGACEEGTRFSSSNCNRKLIGARAFWKGYESIAGKINETQEFLSARDPQGHGTHTASTAGGNPVAGASTLGFASGTARGMRFTARVAAYKACWWLGCASSDILAGVDQAVADGVDVLSLSLGGTSRPFYADEIAIAAFGAIEKGVFVSCSAGNSGPEESSVSNTAPWMMTVAASYLDRRFPTVVKLGDGRTFTGASIYPGDPTKQLPLVYGTSAGPPLARYCLNGTLLPELVRGKIVLCDGGLIGRTEKGEFVKQAGGGGMLLMNDEEQGEELIADAHVLPASSLGISATTAIRGYFRSANRPTASITFLGTAYGSPAPAMTAFSSRGPNAVLPAILKPDLTAPGMNILAAWPPAVSPSLLENDQRRVDFNIVSGTSMSCPHVSGIAALLKSRYPNWSPAAIKSAMMTTAYTQIRNRGTSASPIIDVSNGLPASPFAFGSGHVDPERASKPGLIYDITADEYLRFLCRQNYTSAQVSLVARKGYICSPEAATVVSNDLNYPSFSVLLDSGNRNASTMETRTVTNVGPVQCRYVVRVREPEGVKMTVSPRVLKFGRAGQKLSYRVGFIGLGQGESGSTVFGELAWWACGPHWVRSPVAVTWQ
ncbi:Subtilisin-like protease [Apostasia shenzhenica]|uniref:Subtilisin-like protease n=1 Tax=Apostasia shenzhenica TaxID=1088818 RepID=A0A2I0AX22_9ASPA|nr:Subtilisin-like protease [Apostasia shenzhenica]